MMWCVLRNVSCTCAEESDIFVLAGAEAARGPRVASGRVIRHLDEKSK